MSDEVSRGYRACERITRARAGNFALGIALLPPTRRRALSAVYWFAHNADEAVDGDGPPERRRDRLEALRRAFDRTFDGDPPAPEWAALLDATDRFDVPTSLYRRLLDGVSRDLEPVRTADWEATRAYCYDVASVVGLVGLRIFGGRGLAAERDAEELGYALQLTNILRDVREDARLGRWYLPLDETRRFGVSSGDVAEGRAGAGWEALVAVQVERARRFYAAGDRLAARLPRSTRACPAALAGVYRGLLERIARDPRAPLRTRVSLDPLSKIGRGIGAALRAVRA